MNFYLYKIVSNTVNVGELLKTRHKINRYRKIRDYKLHRLFRLIYKYSIDYNINLEDVFKSVDEGKFKFINLKQYYHSLLIRFEKFRVNFNNSEFRFFIDYILEMKRIELNQMFNLKLPSRYDVCYFFESESDCLQYLQSLYMKNLYIMKIEIVDKQSLDRFDNNWISKRFDGLSINEVNYRVENYWLKKMTETPLMEILFVGEYKVVFCKSVVSYL